MDGRHFDVIIVGAGLSGIGAARHLQLHCPDKRFTLLESRAAMGGTWDLFRYPGVRSDSDMHTLGYRFKPWVGERAIADGPAILDYIHETAAEYDIARHIRYRHRVSEANWSTAAACWELDCEGISGHLTANMLLLCAGYFSYQQGFTPDFARRERFRGEIIHPQHWPQDLDYRDKKIVVIGSGATAMTLVPAIAGSAAAVVMLQRSPTYVVSWPSRDRIANCLRTVLPDRWAYVITRWKNILLQHCIYRKTRSKPEQVKRWILNRLRRKLGPNYDVDKHFTPAYYPWDQRLCLVPDDDLFKALNAGRATVVTDRIEHFTARGIKLQSGRELTADIIVTATGLNMVVLGEIAFTLDGAALDFSDCWTYQGYMCSGVPNLINTFGYINASWTLRADLTAEFCCKLINHMQHIGARQVTPRLRAQDQAMTAHPYINNFSSGYMQRAMQLFPRQGDHAPWLNTQDYLRDRALLKNTRFDDGALVFA